MTLTIQTPTFPGADWESVQYPQAHGLTAEIRDAVTADLDALPTTSFIAVSGGRVLYEYGDTSEISYLASTRKSILSMLYGKYVEAGVIDLDLTMADLGVDEDRGLLPIEMTARIRDLLITSSGVYYPAGSPGGDVKGIPERASKRPGEHYHYNNWDFNVLGYVFEKLTGKTVFQALEQDLALPLQLQDFDPSRQRMLGYPDQSRYLAYHLFMSGRDMARIGLAMARKGQWNGHRVVPEAWVDESTRIHVPAERMGNAKAGVAGYSYLWWIPEATDATPEWRGAFIAAGHFGQFILGMPALDMVFVNRRAIPDDVAIARNNGSFKEELPTVTMQQFVAVAQRFVSGRLSARQSD